MERSMSSNDQCILSSYQSLLLHCGWPASEMNYSKWLICGLWLPAPSPPADTKSQRKKSKASCWLIQTLILHTTSLPVSFKQGHCSAETRSHQTHGLCMAASHQLICCILEGWPMAVSFTPIASITSLFKNKYVVYTRPALTFNNDFFFLFFKLNHIRMIKTPLKAPQICCFNCTLWPENPSSV